MSYKHVFFGDLKKKIFNSKLDELSSDIIDEEERFNYFPNKFTNIISIITSLMNTMTFMFSINKVIFNIIYIFDIYIIITTP